MSKIAVLGCGRKPRRVACILKRSAAELAKGHMARSDEVGRNV